MHQLGDFSAYLRVFGSEGMGLECLTPRPSVLCAESLPGQRRS